MKKIKLLLQLFFLVLLLCIFKSTTAQVPPPITVTNNPTLLDVQNLLFGPDVKVSNLVINCPGTAIGTFSGPTSNIGLTDGLLLTTGTVNNAVGPNNVGDKGTDNPGGPDVCLQNYIGGTGGVTCVVGGACTQAGCNSTSTSNGVCTCMGCQGSGATSYDACSIEFDIIPTCDSIKINYVFGSEEYPEYVNANVSDAFAFFISGPGISGGGCGNSMNMATVPGTGTLVSIDNVNINTNSQYYIKNNNPQVGGTQYDAYTKVLTAKAKVIPCSTYHIKIVIADFGDGIYDSGVFLQKGGISCGAPSLTVTKTDAIECCSNGSFTLTLDAPSPTPLTINYNLSGNATSGTDFTALPGSVIFPAGQTVITIPVTALCDGIAEGAETLTLSIGQAVCAGVITGSATLTITDPPTANAGNDVTICPANGGANLTAAGGGTYSWSPTTGLSNPNIANPVATPAVTTTYIVTVTDAAGCTATDDVIVSVSCGINVTTTPATICNESCGTITASGASGTAPYTYSWSPGGLTGSNISVCPVTTTTYTVIATDNAAKTASATAIVTVNPKPTITLSGGAVCPGACVTITAGGGTTYTWSAPFSGSAATQNACPVATSSYSVTGADANGCTNTAVATITINPLPTVTVTDLTVCKDTVGNITASGANTYTWSCGGTAPSISPNTSVIGVSTCTVTGTDANGCVNTAVSTITVNDCSTPNVSVPDGVICIGTCFNLTAVGTGGVGALTYVWNPNIGSGAGPFSVCPTVTSSYTVTVTDGNGATAQDVAVVTVNPLPTITATTATICNGACATITASGAGTGSYSWASPLGSGTSQNVCPTTTTSYSLTGTDANGCTNTASTTITVNPIPVVSVPNASICPGGSTTLTASGASSYTWSPATGLSSTIIPNPIASPSVTTVYTVIGTSNGCTSSTTVTVSVGALVATISPNVTVCFGACTNLNSGGGTIYSWSPSTGLNNPNISNPLTCPTVTTTYTVNVSDGTCSDDAVVVVNVNSAITLTVAPVNVTCFGACNGQTIVIPSGGNGVYSYNWSNGCVAPSCNNVCAGTYTLTVTDGFGCTATGVTTVTEPPPFSISAIGGNACPGDSIGLTVSGAVTYSWLPTTALTPTSGANVVARPAATTTYTIVGTDASGCTAVTTVVATVNPKPLAGFTTSPDVVDEFDPTVYFTDLSSGGTINSWNWVFGDSANTTSSSKNPIFVYPPVSNQYTVQLIVTNEFGCIDTVIGTVYIRGIFTFYIPNTFTPNNDGRNDGFLPRGVGIDETDYHLWIFDRWGNLIWQTEIWGEAWDGKANNGTEVAQVDTYVWKVHVKEKENGTKHNYIGHVNIVK